MSERPLRLLDINVMWPPEYQPFISGRLKALAAAGVEISVATSNPGPIDPRLLPFARIVRLPSAREPVAAVLSRTSSAVIQVMLKRPALLRDLWRIGRSRGAKGRALVRWFADSVPFLLTEPDVIHFEWNELAIDLDWLPRLLDVPFVVSCRGRQVNIVPHLPRQEARRAALARSFESAALVHGVCRRILVEAEKLGMPPAKGRVVYTSVDADFYHPPSVRASEGPLRLLNVGVSMWRKGYEYLLAAVRRVVDSGREVLLEVADYDGPERDRAEYTIAELGLQNNVVILGKLRPEQVREALWRCDAFVLSALSEGISNAVIEAMACGVPVVTTDCGGMREAVTDGVEGLVVPARDPAAMADAILRLAAAPDLRARMGRAARARVEKDFTAARQAPEFFAIYRESIRTYRKRENAAAEQDSTSSWRSMDENNGRLLDPPAGNAGSDEATLKVVTVAELHWRNGHEYAIEAIAELVKRGRPVHYTLVGKGVFLEAVGFARYELGLMDVMDVVLEESRAAEVLRTADVFLLGAVAPGASHGLAEALDLGIPAVHTDVPEIESLSRGKPDCRVVPRRDKDALANALEEVGAPAWQVPKLTVQA